MSAITQSALTVEGIRAFMRKAPSNVNEPQA
jgi:hypothetical protein